MDKEDKLIQDIKSGVGLTPVTSGPGSNRTGIVVEESFFSRLFRRKTAKN